MPRIHAGAERIIDAEPADVWAALTDYSGARAQMLPDSYRNYQVERDVNGADGAGVTLSYVLHAGGRERGYRMQVEETTPGHALVERDLASTYTTHWLVERVGPGSHARVRLSSEWESRAKGVPGFFERRFAPLGVRRIHQETLVRLGQLMRKRQPAIAGR
jgi:uncharacterized protein YndB with AHSA1/START domain